jgi:hypothetical protein
MSIYCNYSYITTVQYHCRRIKFHLELKLIILIIIMAVVVILIDSHFYKKLLC